MQQETARDKERDRDSERDRERERERACVFKGKIQGVGTVKVGERESERE